MAAIITASINKSAWTIRKAAAAKWACPVMTICWGDCFRAALRNAEERLMSKKGNVLVRELNHDDFVIMDKIDNADLRACGAIYFDSDRLEDEGWYESVTGWRVDEDAIKKLEASGYSVNVETIADYDAAVKRLKTEKQAVRDKNDEVFHDAVAKFEKFLGNLEYVYVDKAIPGNLFRCGGFYNLILNENRSHYNRSARWDMIQDGHIVKDSGGIGYWKSQTPASAEAQAWFKKHQAQAAADRKKRDEEIDAKRARENIEVKTGLIAMLDRVGGWDELEKQMKSRNIETFYPTELADKNGKKRYIDFSLKRAREIVDGKKPYHYDIEEERLKDTI